jgi:hypothetical protein
MNETLLVTSALTCQRRRAGYFNSYDDQSCKLVVLSCVVKGLHHLHSGDIAHRDRMLDNDNLLMCKHTDGTLEVCIAGFECATAIVGQNSHPATARTEHVGAVAYVNDVNVNAIRDCSDVFRAGSCQVAVELARVRH